ncbi:MAG: cell division protein FtsL [Candidatus Tectomicrobia bacterium]|nr:cell division protein FtsL [Candidatus Tectomicrobia bacterium]
MTSQQQQASDTVRRQRRERVMGKPVIFVLFCCTVTVLGGLLLYLWPQMRLVDLGYVENELRGERADALQRQEELRLELDSLSQLSRIEEIAVEDLGLESPQSSQIIYVRSQQNTQGILQPMTREP